MNIFGLAREKVKINGVLKFFFAQRGSRLFSFFEIAEFKFYINGFAPGCKAEN